MSSNGSRRLRPVAILILPLLACGCAGTLGSGPAQQRDIDTLRVSVDRLRQANAAMLTRLDAAEPAAPTGETDTDLFLTRDRLGALEAQMRALAASIDGNDEIIGSLAYEIERLRLRQEDMAQSIGALANSRATPGADVISTTDSPHNAPTTGAPGGVPAERQGPEASVPLEEDPAGVFRRAYADYSRGDYKLAILGLTNVLDIRPDGVLADDAAYYLGEIARAQGRPNDALMWYGQVTERQPLGDKAPAATLKKGLLLIEMNRVGEGVVQLDHLVRTHPQSDEARLARNKLRALGVGR